MAKRDSNPFEHLLRVRERQEDLFAQALAESRRAEDVARGERDAITDEQRRVLDKARDSQEHAFDASDMRRFHQYERHLAQLGVSKDASIQALAKESEAKRAALEDASKRRKVVEKLRERKLSRFQKAQRAEEQRKLDEIAASRAAHRKERGAP